MRILITLYTLFDSLDYEDNALDDDDIKELDLNKEKDVFEK